MDYVMGSKNEIWDGMEGGVLLCAMDKESKGRGKEKCTLLMSSRVWEGIAAHDWMGSRIM